MPDPILELKKALEDAQESLQKAHLLLNSLSDEQISCRVPVEDAGDEGAKEVIEGVFDGLQMIGGDGKGYPVPANYASKSKLVEGDLMKLRVQPSGAFVYKQIGPVDRKRIKGLLMRGETEGDFRVLSDGRSFKVLAASVSFYKGQEGDLATVLVPQEGVARWAAVENIMPEEDTENDHEPEEPVHDEREEDFPKMEEDLLEDDLEYK